MMQFCDIIIKKTPFFQTKKYGKNIIMLLSFIWSKFYEMVKYNLFMWLFHSIRHHRTPCMKIIVIELYHNIIEVKWIVKLLYTIWCIQNGWFYLDDVNIRCNIKYNYIVPCFNSIRPKNKKGLFPISWWTIAFTADSKLFKRNFDSFPFCKFWKQHLLKTLVIKPR